MIELRQQYLRPTEWCGELFLMTIQHRCPGCGTIRKTNISRGVFKKLTLCMGCNSRYQVDRSMHKPGLVNKRVVN